MLTNIETMLCNYLNIILFIVAQVQKEVNNRLGDRVRDIREWKEELRTELIKNEEETEHLEEAKRHLDYAYAQSKRPLQVSIECINHRENRVGIDQVKE